MKLIWPQSLAGRLIVWLILVFACALLLAMALNRFNNERLLARSAQADAVTRLTMLSRVLEQSHKGDWQKTLHAATTNDFRFSIDDNVVITSPNAPIRKISPIGRTIEKKPAALSDKAITTIEFIKDAKTIRMGNHENIYIVQEKRVKNPVGANPGFINNTDRNITVEHTGEHTGSDISSIPILPFAKVENKKQPKTGDKVNVFWSLQNGRPISQNRAIPFGQPFDLVLKLDDQHWLKGAYNPQTPPLWSQTSVIFLGALALAISGVIILVVRTQTKPLHRLAIAAEALGRGEAQAPLTEGGPREVRAAVKAFNLMGARLGRYVQDRTRMLAAMSHDLRTPLTSLRLRAEMIEDTEAREKMIQTIEEMHRITEANLSFACEDDNDEETQPVDIGRLLNELCEEANTINRSVSLANTLPACDVRARPLALRRALRNLIDNAIRYGTHAHLSASCDDTATYLIIEDDGPGINEAQIEGVFAPFVRLENSRNQETGGAGLGLAIARTIARAHGGDVQLKNRDGGGLRATLSLPVEAV